MATRTLKCPKCKTHITVEGEPGEKVDLTCPSCKKKGFFTFPKDIQKFELDYGKSNRVIEVNNLSKAYGAFTAIENLTFHVKKGEVFGFLGPNGAGKTTTIKAILGLIRPSRGLVKINGFDIVHQIKQAKQHVGYLPERVAFYDNLTALQNMYFYAELKNVSKEQCMPLIEEFGLKDHANKRVGKFSKGMIQRLGMARAVLGNPQILILDEPTVGLDPRGVLDIREKIKEVNKKGVSVFISSHILSEIQEVCNRVGIINKGIIVAMDSVSSLSQQLQIKPKLSIEITNISEKIIDAVKKVKDVDKINRNGSILEIFCSAEARAKVVVVIEKAGGIVVNLQTKDPSLEEIFMKFTER